MKETRLYEEEYVCLCDILCLDVFVCMTVYIRVHVYVDSYGMRCCACYTHCLCFFLELCDCHGPVPTGLQGG